MTPDVAYINDLSKKVIENDRTTLAKAITLIESTKKEHQKIAEGLLEKCLEYQKESVRVGITGVPGVGKSTFIENFGMLLVHRGKKVAVLTIDPSSNETKGSILGDKVRMETLSKEKNAFIRPSPTSGSLGGVARKTRETIILLEAAGYDVILIETVGVGQNETAVRDMTDFFLLLKLPGAGDELQGIKRGVMEMADAIAINKADGQNVQPAETAQLEFSRALHLLSAKENGWIPQVMTCSAMQNTGLKPIWSCIEKFMLHTKENGSFHRTRKQQNKKWLRHHLNHILLQDFYDNPTLSQALSSMEEKVMESEITPFVAAERLLRAYRKA
ncbi:methylmalonyl Co-A mutase-associated GTPase MeaB [Maribacter aurantiacus]|uniref:Methylmalonyl Co-A mutase-associated GTPase MeaB n=1 Tax=Maribacter aurantiacus TaxID=1882343 RepID=A0A5R8M870_9FLAO|nr:methylmalonyl Co-A mutase-associated GTPase MeaB [Maribacter aurantiacus]TLF45768.1 methylmalonyl Co-A mutase-associated GTPase MeaB [Maribacter aurantiacus]